MAGTAPVGGMPLLEREVELATVDAFLERMRSGRSARLLVEGPAGIGKSTLLDAASRRAQALGVTVLTAEAREVARHVAFGIARAALGRLWPEDASELEATDRVPTVLASSVAAILDLATEAPVMVVVDDVQWADAASLRWLALLAGRGAGEQIALALAARSDELAASSAAIDVLLEDRGAIVVRPAPLTRSGVAELIGERLGGQLEPELAEWCHEQTGGNPYLARMLGDALRQSGVSPNTVALSQLREIGTRAVARSVAGRLDRLGADERALAETAALVGDVGGLDRLAEVAGLDPTVAADAARHLVEADLLRSVDVIEMTHPLVAATIRDGIAAATRERVIRRAVELLLVADRVEEAAARLVDLPPCGDAEVAETLVRAAELASRRGATDVAAMLLRRALVEPPAPDRSATIRAALGEALLAAGDADAVQQLEQALGEASTGRELARVAIMLALALHYARRPGDAIAALDDARASLEGADEELDEELEALTLHYMSFDPALRTQRLARLGRLGDRQGASELAYRRRLAELAYEALITVRPSDETVALAERALAGGTLLSRDTSAHIKAALVLAYAGRPVSARAHLQDAIAEARRRADAVRLGFVIATHGEVRRLEGEMTAAELDTRTGLELLPPGELGPRFMVRALIEALVEQGRQEEAVALLREGDLAGELPEIVPTIGLLYARARAWIASGSLVLGLEDLLRAGAIAERLELRDPCAVPWRLGAAETLVALGDRPRALELVDEHLELAQRAAVSEAVGAGLRVHALATGGSNGRATLAEAIELLDGGWARLELARALVDMGAAQRDHDVSAARTSLEHGAALAERLGATALVARAADLLLAAGGRPRRAARHGARSLTGAERRTARLAMEGLTNREIAETLVLSEKTIDSQLMSVFRKLGIRSRARLADALTDERT